ncbi:hypothetical protein GH733_001772 [Mirounga leonina]|nr:hypothetical protein GH733_001772 [Mirounga leonina]
MLSPSGQKAAASPHGHSEAGSHKALQGKDTGSKEVFMVTMLSQVGMTDFRDNTGNTAQVLADLKEYATDVDADFARKAVWATGRCAIQVERPAERHVSPLLDLTQTKGSGPRGTVAIRHIFRKRPNKSKSILATLRENLASLDEPDARAAMIWMVGEYAERPDNAEELLESFLEGFHDESTQVQLTLLTVIAKLFLNKPPETQELVQQVLSLATRDSDKPDLRDQGCIYWCLLSTDPVTGKVVV